LNEQSASISNGIPKKACTVNLSLNRKISPGDKILYETDRACKYSAPTVAERLMLWKNNLPKKLKRTSKRLPTNTRQTAPTLLNIIHYACLKTIEQKSGSISYSDLLKGIQKEYVKEGKMINLDG
jgi:hypothetical protein